MTEPTELPQSPRHPVLQETDAQDLVARRKILPEHLHLIEELARLPKAVFINHHNLFGGTEARSPDGLEHVAQRTMNPMSAEFLRIMAALARAYDWTACYNILTFFENRPRELFENKTDPHL